HLSCIIPTLYIPLDSTLLDLSDFLSTARLPLQLHYYINLPIPLCSDSILTSGPIFQVHSMHHHSNPLSCILFIIFPTHKESRNTMLCSIWQVSIPLVLLH